MKLSLLVIVCMCACAPHSSSTKSTSARLDQSYYDPPGTNDLIIKDRKLAQRQAIVNEEKVYQQSLDNITSRVRTEALNLQICKEISKEDKSNDCRPMHKQYCEVDELVDSRGAWHKKPYCSR